MQIVTIKEITEFLKVNVKPKTLYQWAELGQIPCLKLNGALRFDLDDIRTWIQDCKKETGNGYNPTTRLEARKRTVKRGLYLCLRLFQTL